MKHTSKVFAAILLLVAAAALGEPGKISKETISWKGKDRVFFLYVPTGAAPERKLPLVLTLHGSGQSGETYVSAWKDLADEEKVVIAREARGSLIKTLRATMRIMNSPDAAN